MTNLIFGVLLVASASWAQQCPPAAEGLAKAYGLDSFEQIDAIRSTFNIDFPGLKISQSWIWEPKPTGSPMREKTRQAIR